MTTSNSIFQEIEIFGEKIYVVDDVDSTDVIKFCLEKQQEKNRDDESFYIFNVADIIEKCLLWESSFPGIKFFYAVKCNPYPLVLKLLAYMGGNFDCASWSEIKSVVDIGIPTDRIIYANPCKYKEYLRLSNELNVSCMTFDSENELLKIFKHHPTAECILRFFVSTTSSRCPLGLKFGAAQENLPNLIRKCKELNINLCGLSFHVGSGCYDHKVYDGAIKIAREIFDLAEDFGFKMKILDIGGGFPGDLEYPGSKKMFMQCKETINEALANYFRSDMPKIIAEPGRFYAASSMKLICTVVGALREHYGESMSRSYFLNDSIHSSFNCINFDHYIGEDYLIPKSHIKGNDIEKLIPSNEKFKTTFYGITGEKYDIIMAERPYHKVSVGDIIVYKNMGAYTMCACSQYMCMPIPAVYNVVPRSCLNLLRKVGLLSNHFEETTG